MTTRIEVNDRRITIVFEGRTIHVPVDDMTRFAHVVEAARVLAESAKPDTRAVNQAPKSPKRTAQRRSAPRKRRSRKRVGDAVAAWMGDNPGWHSAEALLDVVIAHNMTDANPKRALNIALGRQQGKLFITDGQGNWQLTEAAPSDEVKRPKQQRRSRR